MAPEASGPPQFTSEPGATNMTSKDRSPPADLEPIQDEILTLVRELDAIHTRLRRLHSRIEPGDDAAMIECTAPPSLAFELHGVLDLTSELIARATALLRQAGVETEETVRQQFLRRFHPIP